MGKPQNDSEPTMPTWVRKRPVLRFLRRVAYNWLERHLHPFNRWIHALGIPAALAGVVLLFFFPWYYGVSLLAIGYALQYAGHLVEGNDVGEWAAIKRLVGLPYVSVAPSRQPKSPPPVQTSHST